jgi:nucleoside phosphorylase
VDDSFDLGLICATREEFDFCRELTTFAQHKSADFYYYVFELPGSERRGAAVPLFNMGLVAAAQSATSFLSRTCRYSPS